MDAMTTRANLLDILEPMLFSDLIDDFVKGGIMTPLEGAIRKACYEDDHKPIQVSIWTDTRLKYFEDFMTDDLIRKWCQEKIAERMAAIWRQCGKTQTAFQVLFQQVQRTEEQIACEAILFFRKHKRGFKHDR